MTENIITQKRLKELLHYDPETGIFTRLVSTARRVKVGDVAGTIGNRGYISIRINYKPYRAHRLAFLYMTGRFPKDQTDHINHIRDDNRWKNLRQADNSMNKKNQSMYNNNTSGITGVNWNKAASKWMVRVMVNGESKYLGLFLNIEDAVSVRGMANNKYGFHPNHGMGK